MQPINFIAAETLEQPFTDHAGGTAIVAPHLLSRLKDENDAAGEIAGLCQIAGGAEEHRRVPVVTAGVHDAAIRRTMREIIALFNCERVHISP
ncbi:hypothetical protein D3C87_1899770 [compost metagenome]